MDDEQAVLRRARLVTRRSNLALYQTRRIADLLRGAHPGIEIELIELTTKGDRITNVPLRAVGGKGLFTLELEQKLLADEAEIAVHSLKDLPTELDDGLAWIGSPRRGEARDALVSERYAGLDDLPEGAVVATGSVRRRAQLGALRPDLRFEDLRGNIETRLRKLHDRGFDAIVMAATALERLGMAERITERLGLDRVVPAAGQGAIGIEIRAGRADVECLVGPILDAETTLAARAERAFTGAIEGGCSSPVAAHCARVDEGWEVRGWAGSPDGSRVLQQAERGADPIAIARRMADRFIADGAKALIRGL